MQHEVDAMSESRAIAPDRPNGMAKLEEVTDAMKKRQLLHPEQWTLTGQQWFDVVEYATALKDYKEKKLRQGQYSMYTMSTNCVKPWTAGTGCSLAVMMSQHNKQDAKLMVSHAWGEDIAECHRALHKFFIKHQIPFDSPVWFCVFANVSMRLGCPHVHELVLYCSINAKTARGPCNQPIDQLGSLRDGHQVLRHSNREWRDRTRRSAHKWRRPIFPPVVVSPSIIFCKLQTTQPSFKCTSDLQLSDK